MINVLTSSTQASPAVAAIRGTMSSASLPAGLSAYLAGQLPTSVDNQNSQASADRLTQDLPGMPLRPAAAAAAHHSGTTVTSAGLILAATFGVAGITGATSQIQQLAAAIALGVLLGTFLVRSLMMPAIVVLRPLELVAFPALTAPGRPDAGRRPGANLSPRAAAGPGTSPRARRSRRLREGRTQVKMISPPAARS